MTSASPYSEATAAEPPGDQGATPEVPPPAPGQVERMGLPQKQPPLAASCWLHGNQPGPGQVNVILSRAAVRQIVAHGHSDPANEVGGALLGHAYRQEERVFVEVAAAIPATSDDHGPVHFKFTADAWAELHQKRATSYPRLAIVGWFHTHPDLGVFYSADDVVVHKAAFASPWHVGLVLDPISNEACFFGWVDGELVPLNGFYERHEEQGESAVPWQIVEAAVWDEHHDPLPQSPGYAPESGWPDLQGSAASLSLAAGALGLLLSLFLLLGWVVPLNRRIERLESVALMLADETAAGDWAASCPDRRLRILTPVNGQRIPVGSVVTVVGTADQPAAYQYRVEVRPTGSNEWALLERRRRDTHLGELAVWDTAGLAPTLYEMRLTAVDRNNIILSDSSSCLLEVALTP